MYRLLTNTDKEAIKRTLEIIQEEIIKVSKQYDEKENKGLGYIDNIINKIHLLIECRSKLQSYFIYGLD